MHSAWERSRPVGKQSPSSELQGGRMVVGLIQGETGFWKGQCYSLCGEGGCCHGHGVHLETDIQQRCSVEVSRRTTGHKTVSTLSSISALGTLDDGVFLPKMHA